LAEQDENDDDSKISTRLPFEKYITVLEELLNDNSKNSKNELDSEKIFSKDGNNINKNYIFGIKSLHIYPFLIIYRFFYQVASPHQLFL